MMLRHTFLLLLLSCSLGAADKPNFTGEWKMDADKSDYGAMPKPQGMVRRIEHQDPVLSMKTTTTTANGERTSDYKLTTDGKESVNTVRGSEIKSVVTWDGQALKNASRMNLQGADISMDERWSLSADGKVMTVESQLSGPQGSTTLKLILHKQ